MSEEFNELELTLSTLGHRPPGVLGSEGQFQLFIYTSKLLLL